LTGSDLEGLLLDLSWFGTFSTPPQFISQYKYDFSFTSIAFLPRMRTWNSDSHTSILKLYKYCDHRRSQKGYRVKRPFLLDNKTANVVRKSYMYLSPPLASSPTSSPSDFEDAPGTTPSSLHPLETTSAFELTTALQRTPALRAPIRKI
jgi:hypothetical protein